MDCGLPGFSIHGISQARILEWVVTSSSGGSSWLRDQTPVSCVSCSGQWILYHWAPWKPLIRRSPLRFFSNAHLPSRLRLPCCSWILSYLHGFLMICTVWPWLPHTPSTSLHVALTTSQNQLSKCNSHCAIPCLVFFSWIKTETLFLGYISQQHSLTPWNPDL